MNLMRYLLEANLYLAAFYLLYLLLLRKETFYQLSRAYLLVSSGLAFVIPLLQFGILKPETFTTVSMVPTFDPRELQALPVVSAPVPVHVWTVFDYCLLAYGMVTAVLLLNLCIKIFKLIRLSKRNARQAKDEFILIEIEGESAAFSFFSYLFIDTKLASSETVMRHEEVHIRQKHSWDIIYSELLKVINWFNPFVYLLQNSLKEVHEFIADEYTARLENSNDNYASFLISNAYGMAQNGLTNTFSHKSMLRKRIIMLYQQRSGRAAFLKYSLALPLLCGLLCLSTMAFTNKSYGWIDIAPNNAAKQSLAKQSTNITPLDAAIAELSADTTKKTKASDTAKRVSITLTSPEGTYSGVVTREGVKTGLQKPQPLIVVNGKVMVQDPGTDIKDALAQINPADIASVTVLKDKSSTAIYGEAGANGVILITTKDHEALSDTTKRLGNALRQELTIASQRALDSDIVFTAVEVEPIPKGGMERFYEFLGKNIKYPKADRDNSIQGRVIAQFIVEKDGSLSNIKIMRAPSPTLGEEAVRVLNLAPNWTPGVQNGRPVRVQYTIPINFALNDVKTTDHSFDVFYKEITGKIRYPQDDKQNGVVGRALVTFNLDENKQINDVQILRGISKSTSEELIRAIKSCKEVPSGKPNTSYILPIFFALIDKDGKYTGTGPDRSYVSPPRGDRNVSTFISLSQITVTAYK
jgi:TonB family protein